MTLAAPLPTGAVTFAFTDIEGSTVRWERDRAAMQEAVLRHDAIMRATITEHAGHVFKTIGDAFCAAFERPEDAVAAVLAAQQVLAAQDFSAVDGLRVRMALHTGDSDERDGDYFGPVLNRVARLLAVAHGGQVLISGATAELFNGRIPVQGTLRDLGFAQLKDLSTPEHVWQLDIAGLPNEFPPLRTLDALPNNLPLQRTTFVGRENDVAEVKDLLDRHHLLTLVGSGGVGKTRLAIQVGADLLDRYPDGVWFVDLAPIDNPELVASVVAQAIGMSQQGQRVDEQIPPWLKRKKLLLIFDNCEHVLEPIAALATAILTMAQDVRIVATSRQALNISGEVAHSLPSLTVPAETTRLTPDEALAYGAIALFVDRARAVDTHFTLTDATAPIVAEICRRLDGIALAIELAAARVKVLSIPNLAQRLNDRFKLLTGGSRDALPRQKTLTALIDWSYDLLTPQEQLLFARLGVFAGGFGLEAATSICGGEDVDEIDILDLLASLTDKSLVVADTSGEHERYRLLESTAAYALEKLSAAGEREAFTRRHAEYFRDQALAADERWGTCSTHAWVAAAELELDNDRAALEWTLTRGNDAVLGGAIVGALGHVWWSTGLSVEGRYWIALALERVTDAEHPQVAARLWTALCRLESGQRARDAAERAMALNASVGDARGTADVQKILAYALFQMGRRDEAQAVIEQALAALRTCGEPYLVASCLGVLADIVTDRGDIPAARELYAQALAAFKSIGNEAGTATVLGNLAMLEFAQGHPELALRAASEAHVIHARGKNVIHLAGNHVNIAAYQIALGDLSAACDSAREGLRLARQVREEPCIASGLQHLALLAVLRGDARRGALLLGYVDAQGAALEMQRDAAEQRDYDKLVAALSETLSKDEIARLAADGASWSEGQAVEEALKV